MTKSALFCFLALCATSHGFSSFTVAKSFSEHAVLQAAPASARVWGWSDAGSTITAYLNCTAGGGTVSYTNVTAASDGLWVVSFPPQPPSLSSCVVSFTDSLSGAEVWYLDIVFGQVLLCGGQSNMDLGLNYVINATEEAALANNYGQSIRLLQVPLQGFIGPSSHPAPLREFSALIPWTRASNVTTWGFSAECWLTARNLVDSHYDAFSTIIPIGAIQSDWPGASITQLSSPAALAQCANVTRTSPPPRYAKEEEYSSTTAIDGLGFPGPIPGPSAASSQWNAMIAPLTVGPLAIGAFIYHQGEADCHGWYAPGLPVDYATIYTWYSCQLRSLIADWRAIFTDACGAWFGITQLAPYAGDCSTNNGCDFVAAIRAAQLDVAQSTPNVTAAVIDDLGDPTAPAGSVHSRRKQGVATRLVTGALTTQYGAAAKKGPVYGPSMDSFSDSSVSGATLSADISFTTATVPEGLQFIFGVNGTSTCPIGQSPTAPTLSQCSWFSIEGVHSGWVNATTVEIVNQTAIRISAPATGSGDSLLAVAFGQSSYPIVVLYSAGSVPLPVVPFNTSFVPPPPASLHA